MKAGTTQPRATTFPEPQPDDFAFNAEMQARAEKILARYPDYYRASAVVPLLDLAQRQIGGHLTPQAIEYVAKVLDMAPIRAHEIATFYSQFNHKPVGKHFIQVCRTTPCMLCGADDLTRACLEKLGVGIGEVTEDGMFSVREVECLGACVNAPMVQINDDYYEDLTPERLSEIIDLLRAGEEVPIGSQTGRLNSAPEGGPQTLLECDETGYVGGKSSAAKSGGGKAGSGKSSGAKGGPAGKGDGGA